MTIVTPEPTIDRDRYGRPLVKPANGDKPQAYTRATTYISCIEDTFNLQKWMQRQVAIGLSSRPDLLLSTQAHLGDKRELDRICDSAREAAASSAAATTGTALHALTELIDRGQKLPAGLSPAVQASLDAYVEATKEFKATHIEQFCVQDLLKVGGTPDRIVQIGRKKTRYIADVKTGSIEFGILKIAMQLALYARSKVYDIRTGTRSDHNADIERGLVIHLPAVTDPAEARCDLVWVDLLKGWNAVMVAREVRGQRALKYADIATAYNAPTQAAPVTVVDPLLAQIDACTTSDAIRALWREDWTSETTDYAAKRAASLDGNNAA